MRKKTLVRETRRHVSVMKRTYRQEEETRGRWGQEKKPGDTAEAVTLFSYQREIINETSKHAAVTCQSCDYSRLSSAKYVQAGGGTLTPKYFTSFSKFMFR